MKKRMTTFAIVNHKGGVGKTTTATNLAYSLAMQGKDVLLIDLDHQAHSTEIFCSNVEDEKSVCQLFMRSDSIENLLAPAEVDGKRVPHLDIIPSTLRLCKTAETIVSHVHREKLLKKQIDRVANHYDYLLIDCPPALSVLTVNAIYAADSLIIPTTYSGLALTGIADLFESAKMIKETEHFNYRILRNQKDARKTIANNHVDKELKPFTDSTFNTIIRSSESINQSQIMHQPVQFFEPSGKSTDDFLALSQEVLAYA